MKRIFIPLCAMLCAKTLALGAAPAAGGATNLVDKGSYALGANIGNSFRTQGTEPNLDQFITGIKDGLGGNVKLSDQELREAYFAWQQEARQKKLNRNKQEGEEFLAKKAKEPGVKSFPDGLLYKVLVSGKGPQPKPDDTVSAHYRGTLIAGTEFDSSYSRGKPFVTAVRGVVPGWQEALTNMHVGDKWELYIPSQLAYGERGAGAKIGPNAALVFEMELLGIEPPGATPGPGAAAPGAGTPGQPVRVQPAPGSSQPVRVQPAPGK
jgi:FKBP-type peptidyl-prolyl cis-trans isomerase FklB